jgi:CheY-like chemotaxis protein
MGATRRIRASTGPNRAVPIIALTADVLEAQREECLAAGMTGHVAKPIDVSVLLAAVAEASTRGQGSGQAAA